LGTRLEVLDVPVARPVKQDITNGHTLGKVSQRGAEVVVVENRQAE
jgi:hypothetical protein